MRQNVYRFQKHGHTVAPDLFVSLAKENETVEGLQDKLKMVIDSAFPNVEGLLNTVQTLGLPVLVKGPEFQLKLSLLMLGAQPGFIPPTLRKYDLIVDTLKKYFPHKAHLDFTQGVLVVPKDGNQYTFLTYHLYHWTAFKHGLSGYDALAKSLYDRYVKRHGGKLHADMLEGLDINQVVRLRAAIRRDREAMEFVQTMLDGVFIPRNNAKLIEKGQAQA